jgi:hypothetical protein
MAPRKYLSRLQAACAGLPEGRQVERGAKKSLVLGDKSGITPHLTCYSFHGTRVMFQSPPLPERNDLTEQILNAIDAEIAKLRQVRAILTDGHAMPAGKSATTASPTVVPKGKIRRKLSAKARKAIADAQRRRWAKVHSQKKATTAATAAKKESAAS